MQVMFFRKELDTNKQGFIRFITLRFDNYWLGEGLRNNNTGHVCYLLPYDARFFGSEQGHIQAIIMAKFLNVQ